MFPTKLLRSDPNNYHLCFDNLITFALQFKYFFFSYFNSRNEGVYLKKKIMRQWRSLLFNLVRLKIGTVLCFVLFTKENSLNFIRLLRVVITPSGVNESKQSDEFQARKKTYSEISMSDRFHVEGFKKS